MWAFIDRAYVITLDSATHRHPRIHTALQTAGLASKAVVFKAQRHPVSGRVGCWESHVAVVDQARADGCRVALVLEDDFDFTPDFAQYLPVVADFVRTMPPTSWDFLMLGVYPIKTSKAGSEVPASIRSFFQRVHCGWQAHAYLVNTTVIAKGIQPRTMSPFIDQQIDCRLFCGNLTKKQRNNYMVSQKPAACLQGADYPLYTTYALQPQIAVQAYDGTTNTGNMSKLSLQLVARPKFMRMLQTTSNYVDTPTCYKLVGVGAALLCVGLIVLIVVLTCTGSAKQSSGA
jgi:GR25 family glycosyltransferase involved in LPS biosynthesis